MKIVITSLAILLFPAVFVSQNPQSTDAKDVIGSAKHLLASEMWRNGKLETSSSDVCKFKVSKVSIDTTKDPKTASAETSTSLSLSFADIDPGSVEVMPMDRTPEIWRPAKGYFRVRFHTTNLNNVIVLESTRHQPERSSIRYLDVKEADASKLVGELKRAAQLCGGKESRLPLERVFEFEVKTKTVGPNDNSDQTLRSVNDDYPYHLCKGISHDVQMEGNSTFARYINDDGSVDYFATAIGDNMFSKPSSVSANVKIIETLDRAKSNCGELAAAFPNPDAIGPSYGWVRQRDYIKGDIGDTVEVHAPEPNKVYCTHKVVVYTREGGNGHITVYSWDMKSMAVTISENRQGELPGAAGEHLGIFLYVRFLNRRNIPECTAPPPAGFNQRHQRLRLVNLSDGSIFFEYDPNNNPSDTPH